jgi:hypothetical protein
MLRQFEGHLTERDWREVQGGVEVKLLAGPEGQERFLLARSRDRRLKEQAMPQRFLDRMEAGLEKLKAAAESGRLADSGLAHRRLGRLQQRCWRSAGAFEVSIEAGRKRSGKAKLSVSWRRNRRWSDWAALSEACCLLRTNLTETDPATLWKRYIQRTDAEWAFRITKDELLIRPIWHPKAERVAAHILVCFLVYVLWKTLAGWMARSGLGDAQRTLIEELARIKSGDVRLTALGGKAEVPRTICLRCVTTPDPAQKVLLNRLGLRRPQRLRRVDEIAQM